MKFVIRLAFAGIAVGLVVLALKYAAYLVTGSVALYSTRSRHRQCGDRDRCLLAVRLSAVPPDAKHPYGHHQSSISLPWAKAFIGVAALAILRKAYFGYLDPQPVAAPVRARYQRLGKRDQRHLVLRLVRMAGAFARQRSSPTPSISSPTWLLQPACSSASS